MNSRIQEAQRSAGSIIALCVFALISCFPAFTQAGEIKVIANPGFAADVISPDELKRIYLREPSSLSNGAWVEPVLRNSGAAQSIFLKRVLDMSDDSLQVYYETLVYTGKGSMPRAFASDQAVVAYVARTKDAIGYVSDTANTEGVKILALVPGGREPARVLLKRVEPEYPDALKTRGIRGTVRLAVTVSPTGTVEKVEVLGGNPILAECAIAAVKQWIYTPAHSPTVAEVSIPFKAMQ